jgi:glycine/D-amino acid oxidase-like deaminating enzyme
VNRHTVVDPTIGYGALSYWQDTAEPVGASRRIVPGQWFDVVVVGGGLVGLFAAYQILERNADLSVAVIEKEEVGFGASGRSAGIATDAMGASALDAFVAAVGREGIECDLRSGCRITVGGSGIPTGSTEDRCVLIHPLKLARALAGIVSARGAAVYERTTASFVDEQNRVRVETSDGAVYARVAVIAAGAWASGFPAFRRNLVPKYMYAIASEPLSAPMRSRVDWDGCDALTEPGPQSHHYRLTEDGRILCSGGELVARFPPTIGAANDRHEQSFARLQAHFSKTFPQLEGVRFTHAWGGPVAVSPDGLARFASLSSRLHYGWTHAEHDVSASFLGGRILSDLVAGDTSDHGSFPFVGEPRRRFAPQPLRALEIYGVRSTGISFGRPI